MPELPRVIFILPAYRKGRVLRDAIARVIECFGNYKRFEIQILVVLDGPDQESVFSLSEIADPRVSLIQLPKNMGKGFAIQSGSKFVDGDVVVLLDADLDIHPSSALLGIEHILDDGDRRLGCAYGSKFHPQSEVSYPMIRRVLSRCFNLLLRVMCGLRIDDSQVGLKVMHTSVFKKVVERCTEKRFLFDVELLHNSKNLGLELVPIPVKLFHQFDSTINFWQVMRMFIDLTVLSRRLRSAPYKEFLVSK